MILSEFKDARVDACYTCKKVVHGHDLPIGKDEAGNEVVLFFCKDCSPAGCTSCVECWRIMNAELVAAGKKPMSCGLFPWEVATMKEKGLTPPADIEHWEWK